MTGLMTPFGGPRARAPVLAGSEVEQVEGVAATVAGRAQWAVDAAEATAFVQFHRRVHAAEGLEVAVTETEAACGIEAARHQRGACTEAAQRGQEIHLAQLAGIGGAAFQGRDAAAALDGAVALDDEIGTARGVVRAVHPVDLGVVDREAAPGCAELGHDRADDAGDVGVVVGFDGADLEGVVGGHVVVRSRRRAKSSGARPGANRKPWPTGTPSSSRKRRCASDSTPSATSPSPRLRAMPATAWHTATSERLPGTPCRKYWLSLSPWIGRRRR